MTKGDFIDPIAGGVQFGVSIGPFSRWPLTDDPLICTVPFTVLPPEMPISSHPIVPSFIRKARKW